MEKISESSENQSATIDSDTHELLTHIIASVGDSTLKIGHAGKCRYCGNHNSEDFRKVAHTLPEGLGNKWIVSLNECDRCNELFSQYESALVSSIGAVLTIGGTKGKNNSVRQTGRSKGPHIKHGKNSEGRRHMSMRGIAENLEEHVHIDPASGIIRAKMPIPPERFIPRFAYKALVKMALAIMPEEELKNFGKLREWLLTPKDNLMMPHMNVGLSFGSLGNAPQLAAMALIRRKTPDINQPYMLFILSIGCLCFQLDLKSDDKDGQWPPLRGVACGIKWKNVISGNAGSGRETIEIPYGMPVQLDWSSTDLSLSPIEALVLKFNPATEEGSFTPVFRKPEQDKKADS